ncbi:MAG: DNA damage-inducible protein D [Chloroflexota bacterium]
MIGEYNDSSDSVGDNVEKGASEAIVPSNRDGQHASLFEQIRMEGEDEGEYWSARDLAKVLGYSKWEKFKNAIERAEIACENSGQPVEEHFLHTTRVSTFGRGGQREIEDVHLSRYGCYLLVQNADPTKPAVAMGQTYFAVQTRRQEQADEFADQLAGLSEDQRRLYLRGEISVYNRKLAEAANLAGVVEPLDFAIFTDHGYMGLYGGLKSRDIQKRKGLKPSQHILDHMSGTELAANLFRVTQTEDKLRREEIQGKAQANRTHYDVGRKVRQTIQELGGSPPEELPVPDESVQQLRRKEEKRLKQAQQDSQMPLLTESVTEHEEP